jgi:hypothetical protein
MCASFLTRATRRAPLPSPPLPPSATTAPFVPPEWGRRRRLSVSPHASLPPLLSPLRRGFHVYREGEQRRRWLPREVGEVITWISAFFFLFPLGSQPSSSSSSSL